MKTVCAHARAYSGKRAPPPRGRARTGTEQLSVLDHRTRLERWLSPTANCDGRVVYRRHRSRCGRFRRRHRCLLRQRCRHSHRHPPALLGLMSPARLCARYVSERELRGTRADVLLSCIGRGCDAGLRRLF